MAREFIYQMQGLKKYTPDGKQILDGIWLSFFPGAKIGIVGPNGAGKSTLLKIMAGIDKEIVGETWVDPSAKVGFLAQEPQLDPSLDVRGNIELGVKEIRDLLTRFEEISMKFGEEMTDDQMNKLIEEQGKLQDQIDAVNAWDLDRTVDIAMDALRVPAGDADVSTLSGGERRRVALCRLLLSKPDLLLLDEPTNHLDAETVAWLERALREYHGTVIIVTHDRYFLDNVTQWILELESGKGIPFEGNYSSWLDQKRKHLEQKEKANSAKAKMLARELEWVRMGQKARQAKSEARLKRYDEMRRDFEENREQDRRRDIIIPPGPRLGDVVVEAKNLRKGYGDRLLIEDLNFNLPKNGIVGVIGPNGAGKTTLFRMITGEETPDEGQLVVGETVKISNVTQTRDDIGEEKTVWEIISGGAEVISVGKRDLNSRAYCGAFGFKGRAQQQKVGTLSGGERNRVHLARTLLMEGNLLLLDEPTNDLDVETLRELEDALEDFAGCAVIISHDRWFLDRLATHMLAFEGNSQVTWFTGNYEEYERDRKARLGEDADRPKRIKYKPITR
ncbi:energy-dependent translational throttle protein EttA [Microvenator marinus]|uniref:Energy-dependent translational throttle protein EttA n=1 Tax=Microvenator marinus TaxID=2600177 RepID=A0A5B8XMH9_9DELT|nr:energy-dependent translational throttle protein EttA [Microvenator marinus]QED26864.1 energy-dependent translational throttle protein EttA [Microvenator marinus]